jgi:hypothetical protein
MIPTLEVSRGLSGLLQTTADPKRQVEVVSGNVRRVVGVLERLISELAKWSREVRIQAIQPFVVVNVTHDYLAHTGELIRIDSSDGSFSITLPPANAASSGRSIFVSKPPGGSVVYLLPAQGETIGWDASKTLPTSSARRLLISDGQGNWEEVS